MRAPAAVAALPLLAGCAAGVLLVDLTPERLILAAAAASLFALIAGCGFFAERCAPAVAAVVAGGFACAGFSLGTSCARELYAAPLASWYDRYVTDAAGPTTVIGTLREDAARTATGVSIVLDTGGGGARLSVGGVVPDAALAEWRAGRQLRVPALLRRPTTYRNPGVEDDARALARRGIALVGSVKSAALIDLVDHGSVAEEAAAKARRAIRSTLSRHVGRIDGRSAAVATAILIGDRTALPDDDQRRMQDAGIYHVIAISGGNIAIFTVLLLACGRVLRMPPRASALIAIAVLLFYGEIAGGAASVQRAISAAVIFLSALALDHRGRPLNTLAVAGVLAVAISPIAVVDPGFLLSFGATSAIVLGVPRLLAVAPRPRLLTGVVVATFCAELALTPVAATLFSRVTAAGLVANLAAIPLMTIVQVGSMATVLAAPVQPLWADALGIVVHYSAYGLVESARFVEYAPWLARDVAPPATWLLVVYYAGCAGLFLAPLRRAAAIVVVIALVCTVFGPPSTGRDAVPRAPGLLRVVVLDVGQGDATVIVLPRGRALLVDTGGVAGTSFDIGGRVIAPALRALGVRELEALVLTHPDPDHIGGAESITRLFQPAAIWEGVPVPPHPVRRALVRHADAAGIAWRTVRPGLVERWDDVEIRVLHPPEPAWERQRVRNDDSVVLEVRRGDVSILLPGDIGREVEESLLPALSTLAPLVILKAAHHGSATSSGDALIEATKPRAVIFSTGQRNMFGHPAPSVVDRFARRGIPTFNTAKDGAVFVDTNGRSVRVWGWAGESSLNDSHSTRFINKPR